MKGVCEVDSHGQPVEAEVIRESANYIRIQLRCPKCGRRKGVRLRAKAAYA